MNPIKKLAGQTAIYGFSSVIGRLLNYLLVPLYTRYFLPSEYGVVTEIYAYVAFLVVILTYGMEVTFFRFLKKEYDEDTVFSTTLISIVTTSLVFIGLVFVNSQGIAEWMGYQKNKEYVEWFAIIVGLDAISAISFAKLRAQYKALQFTIIRLINIFTNISLNLYFIIVQGFGIEYIFISNLIASIITVIILLPVMFKSRWTFDSNLWRKMLIYAIPLVIAGLAGITNETLDRILLKHYLVNSSNYFSEVGLYGAFYKLSIIMILFIQTFRYAAEPFFFAQEKKDNAKENYALVMKYFIIITAIIFLTVTTYYDFIKSFLGSEYHDERGFLVVSILLLANLFLGVYYNLSVWYKLTDQTKYGAYISIFGAVITIVFNICLIPKIGFIGSAWATLICYFSMVLASYLIGRRFYPIPYEVRKITGYLVLMLALFFLSQNLSFGMLVNSIYILIFVSIVILAEKITIRIPK